MCIKSALCIKLFKLNFSNIFRSYDTSHNDITANNMNMKSLMEDNAELDTGQDILLIPSSNSSFTSLPVQKNLENKSTEVDEEETIPEEIEEKDDDKIETESQNICNSPSVEEITKPLSGVTLSNDENNVKGEKSKEHDVVDNEPQTVSLEDIGTENEKLKETNDIEVKYSRSPTGGTPYVTKFTRV